MAVKTRLRIGDILVKEGLINAGQLEEAIRRQKASGKRLGEALVEMGAVSEEKLAEVLGRQLGIPYKRFEDGGLRVPDDPAVRAILPDEIIRKEKVLPLEKKGGILTVALPDPLDLILIDNLKKRTGCRIQTVIATRSDLEKAVETAYGKLDLLKKAVAGTYQIDQAETGQTATALEQTAQLGGGEASVEDLEKQAGQAQVVRLVDLFLMEAIRSRASDIHIEPYPSRISVRFRVDGSLQSVAPPSPRLMPALISRIKIMARMDIAEKRLPQDGGFTVKAADRTIDLRVSTVPVVYGEKVVIRLLDKSNLVSDFEALGLEGKAKEDLLKGIHRPNGLVFITGPTGSGKSTTLYTGLLQLRDPSKNIVTIEDPVEYKIDGINQVQAKPQIGLTFASGLRAFLRQDPDIIMVGEVRDLETAKICVQAALTGHLVLSTLHTNDAASAVTRLIDLGIEPFLLSPSLVVVVAQRLVRKLCDKCKTPFDPPEALRKKAQLPQAQFRQPKGCETCLGTGFKGRIGLYEVLRVDAEIRDLINKRASAAEIKEAARRRGMKTLYEAGLEKAAHGLTSLEEVLSVAAAEE